ncbi:hypothetical protein ACP70R_043237 [Stipagrostis hirtigluma subsp. patula]
MQSELRSTARTAEVCRRRGYATPAAAAAAAAGAEREQVVALVHQEVRALLRAKETEVRSALADDSLRLQRAKHASFMRGILVGAVTNLVAFLLAQLLFSKN